MVVEWVAVWVVEGVVEGVDGRIVVGRDSCREIVDHVDDTSLVQQVEVEGERNVRTH